MEAIILKDHLRESLRQDAEQAEISINELVNEVVEHYLQERQQAKLDEEIAAFTAMFVQLRESFLGQWVAIHDQQLADHDSDGTALYQRIRAKYGRTPILIRQVTEQLIDEVWVRTPSTGRIAV
jgi:hypothetical protein